MTENMKIETLIVTVDNTDTSLAGRMNVQTDTIVGNQCGIDSVEVTYANGNRVTYINTSERGVGRNRNTVLEASTSDICILADDDMHFIDGYPVIANRAFEECPDADIVIFNLIEKVPRRYRNVKTRRIGRFNYARYGAARIAFLRSSVVGAGICFNTHFGGGTEYSAGEDTIFLKECLDKHLKIYAVPYDLAEIDQDAESTWFTGYNEKFFHDKGALYAFLYPAAWSLFSLRFLLLKRKKYGRGMSFCAAFRYMVDGGKEMLRKRRQGL